MRLDQIDPMEDLDMALRWSKGTVYLLKVRYTDKYFVSLTNSVNFGNLSEAKIFEDRDELKLQYDKMPTWFKKANTWEVLKLSLEDI